MFIEGQSYNFNIIENGMEKTIHGMIDRYDHPLVKLTDTAATEFTVVRRIAETGEIHSENSIPVPAQSGRILNITSIHFVSAVPSK